LKLQTSKPTTMVKMVRVICIVGIMALLVLFVLFTGNGRSSSKKDLNEKSFKGQTMKSGNKATKKIEISSQVETIDFNRIIPW